MMNRTRLWALVWSLWLWVVISAAATTTTTTRSSSVTISNGLRNLGNTCYLNSQLQCAFHIPKVRNMILSTTTTSATTATTDMTDDTYESNETETDTASCTTTTTLSKKVPPPPPPPQESLALLALRKVFVDMQLAAQHPSNTMADSVVVASPAILCQVLGINVLQQQDSQEFWKLLLPELQVPALMDLYQGAFEDVIRAKDDSGRERRREESFLDLSLDVIKCTTVVEALHDMFGTPEVLSVSEGNGWRPSKGADKVDALKGLHLQSQGLPSILQLHLKRFQYDWNTDTTSKVNTPFGFSETLDLSEICQDTNDDTTKDLLLYDLQAVVVHAGEYGSGHYYAYVRPNVRTSDWYRFNDHCVESVTFDEVAQDATGGKVRANNNKVKSQGGGGFLARIKRSLLQYSGTNPYGYGGSTSNAYVLQYVRRCDIPRLYDDLEED